MSTRSCADPLRAAARRSFPRGFLAGLASCVVAATAWGAWPAHVEIPVKVGQTKVDPAKLPFACITIGTADARVPIERVILEDLDTRRELVGSLGQLFHRDRPNYPYGGDEKRRALSMAILRLPPGHYRLKSVEFTPEGVGVNTMIFTLPDEAAYRFRVKAGCVNYVGSVIFSADWAAATTGGEWHGNTLQKGFASAATTERTAKRDKAWAAKLIPCLADLPSQESPFGE